MQRWRDCNIFCAILHYFDKEFRMAEYGSHHATSGGEKPSIFEVLGQENLVSGLRAGFRHIFKFLAENFPEKYGLLFKYFDAVYTLVDSCFQYVHLRLKGGLFTESFYGLKRMPDPRTRVVSKKRMVAWVILAVAFPFLRSQLEHWYKNIREKEASGSLNHLDLKKKIAVLYLKIYPVLHFAWETTILGYYMAYALGKSDYHSPLLHLTSTKLSALKSEDLIEGVWMQDIPKEKIRSVSTKLWTWLNGFVGGVTLSISVGAFFMQFLEWWYTQERSGSSAFSSLPIPPPPAKWPCGTPIDICPVCNKKRTNDTALSSSGFVFCYPCIFRYIQEHGVCPVTGYPSTLGQLVKLYHQE